MDTGRSESSSLSGHYTITAAIAINLFADALLVYNVRVTVTHVAGNMVEATE